MTQLGTSGNELLHDHDLNYILFHPLLFAFYLTKAVAMIKHVR